MSTFIILAITISVILTYTKSIFKPKKKRIEAQRQLIETFKSGEQQGLSSNAMKKMTLIMGIIITVYYLCFYIMSGFIINTHWAHIFAAIYGVLSIRNYMQARELIKFEKLQKERVFDTIISVIGLLYSLYFFCYYVSLKFAMNEVPYLTIGLLIGIIIVIIFKKIIKRKTI